LQVNKENHSNHDDDQANDPVGPVQSIDGKFVPEEIGKACDRYPPGNSADKNTSDSQKGFKRMRKLQNYAVTCEYSHENEDRERIR
jgi:hypothetical protein